LAPWGKPLTQKVFYHTRRPLSIVFLLFYIKIIDLFRQNYTLMHSRTIQIPRPRSRAVCQVARGSLPLALLPLPLCYPSR